MRDTIFAPASGAGRAAVAVVRISGPEAGSLLTTLCGNLPTPRYASLRKLRNGPEVLDEALILWMPGPASFTGEDCAELHIHGGQAVMAAVASALAGLGARLAEPGEFTRRAFEAGKLDLTQAEAIADLVDAETDAQRRQATSQLNGDLSRRFEAWREALLDALAMVEAAIDFPDDDVPMGVVAEAADVVAKISEEIRSELDVRVGQTIRDGFKIALIGAPNVGKSSLINALSGRDAAIVTPIAGTTRDIIEVRMDIGGYAVVMADTAGLRETADPIEMEGLRRAGLWRDHADLRIAVIDATNPSTVQSVERFLRPGDIIVANKNDLVSKDHFDVSRLSDVVRTSVVDNDIADLERAVIDRVTSGMTHHHVPSITRMRHRQLLVDCVEHLERSKSAIGADLAGEDLRLALRALDGIVGRSGADAVLDRVFSTFCIGK